MDFGIIKIIVSISVLGLIGFAIRDLINSIKSKKQEEKTTIIEKNKLFQEREALKLEKEKLEDDLKNLASLQVDSKKMIEAAKLEKELIVETAKKDADNIIALAKGKAEMKSIEILKEANKELSELSTNSKREASIKAEEILKKAEYEYLQKLEKADLKVKELEIGFIQQFKNKYVDILVDTFEYLEKHSGTLLSGQVKMDFNEKAKSIIQELEKDQSNLEK